MEETRRAQQAWAVYAKRRGTLDDLASHFRECKAAGQRVPTVQLSTLKAWSSAFGWQDRLDDIVRRETERAEAEAAEEIRKEMTTGLAAPHERTRLLKHIVSTLSQEFDEPEKLWLPDVKQIGSGEDAERVDIVRFNGSLVEQLRGGLDDLAKETGGRIRKAELSGPNGGEIPIKVLQDIDLDRV